MPAAVGAAAGVPGAAGSPAAAGALAAGGVTRLKSLSVSTSTDLRRAGSAALGCSAAALAASVARALASRSTMSARREARLPSRLGEDHEPALNRPGTAGLDPAALAGDQPVGAGRRGGHEQQDQSQQSG